MSEPSVSYSNEVIDLSAFFQASVRALEKYVLDSDRQLSEIKDISSELKKELAAIAAITNGRPIHDDEALRIKAAGARQGLRGNDLDQYLRTAINARLALGATTDQINRVGAVFTGQMAGHMDALTYVMDMSALIQKRLGGAEGAALEVMTAAQTALRNYNLLPEEIAAWSIAAMGKLEANGSFQPFGFTTERSAAVFDRVVGVLDRFQSNDVETTEALKAAGINVEGLRYFVQENPSKGFYALMQELKSILPENLAGAANRLFGDTEGPVIAKMVQNQPIIPNVVGMIGRNARGSLDKQAQQLSETQHSQAIITNNAEARTDSLVSAKAAEIAHDIVSGTLSSIGSSIVTGLAGLGFGKVVEKIAPRLKGRAAWAGLVLGALAPLGASKAKADDLQNADKVPTELLVESPLKSVPSSEPSEEPSWLDSIAGYLGLAGGLGMLTTGTIGKVVRPVGAALSYGEAAVNFYEGDNAKGLESAAGATGALTGALAGAALGSIVPGVGTAIGGLIGGALFGFGGDILGRWLGREAAQALDLTDKEASTSTTPLASSVEARPLGSVAEAVPLFLAQREPEVWALLQKLDVLPQLMEKIEGKITQIGMVTQDAFRNSMRLGNDGPSLDYSVRHGGLPVSHVMGA